jgi:hypothetical protein
VATVSGIAMIVLGIEAIYVKAKSKSEYQQAYYEYIILNEKLQEDNSNYYLLAGNIIDYNNKVINDRCWGDNFWVGWYNNGLIKDLPLISVN